MESVQPFVLEEHSRELPCSDSWKLEIENEWDVLGPFPQHAREQHFSLTELGHYTHRRIFFVSSRWWCCRMDKEKNVRRSIRSFVPRSSVSRTYLSSIESTEFLTRWKQLRATEGWSILQHHALLHTRLRISPPPGAGPEVQVPTSIIANIRQASFFAIIPEEQYPNYTPKWHNGNIYDLPNSPDQIIELPNLPDTSKTTIYHIVISADSEIRLFGDPLDVNGQEAPIQRIMIDFLISPNNPDPTVSINSELSVAPDFIDGWALSEGVFGIGVVSHNSWWEVSTIHINSIVRSI
ncbi:1550_t:CDS:2 [Acaulospora colombiana]|uniref:1550_t:CDS:1 n=1 Tax=Acaulospora colombiana TaxID=27376 RepID=A0ACA9MSB1_9GLOM|nr:1550_t:CDS:2 [Acaulospora colombiana]